jgi:two-component system sensor histidine kinase KdpD
MYFERIFFEEQSQNAKRLQESERLYHTILNSVSHEIKTPITTIMGSLGTLNRSEIRKNEQATSDLIADGIEATVRLNNVVNNLLDMSRLESGHLGLCPSVCDPYDLGERSLLYIGNVNIRGRVQVKVVEKVPSLRCDFHLLQQAISNLIINAVKYSPPETPVLVNVEAVNSYVEFQIIDDGPGIPLNEQDRIFDKFYQLKNIVQGGTGLGLSLVKGIVESHQGYINCISDGKSGAKFVIGVPVHSESSTV